MPTLFWRGWFELVDLVRQDCTVCSSTALKLLNLLSIGQDGERGGTRSITLAACADKLCDSYGATCRRWSSF